MSEYDHEPVRGLPGHLPADEHVIWQGGPDWKSLALTALHIRLSAFYFAAIAVWAVSRGDMNTATAVSVFGVVVVGMFTLFAWGVGRTSVYTLTNKRLVLRIGVALNTCINVPLGQIEAANLKLLPGGHGNIVLSLKGAPRLGYLMLWPHARSLRLIRPQPMLRAIPDARSVAALLFKATQKVLPVAQLNPEPGRRPAMPTAGVPA